MSSINNFNGNFGGDHIDGDKYVGVCEPPPNDHPNARECPQCWKSTWVATRECVRCGCDVWHHDEMIAQKKKKAILKARAHFFYGCTFLSITCLLISTHFLPSGFMIFFFLSSLLLLKIATDLDESSK
ncbi:hypothetical protein MN869_18570 [Acinetobacter sp. NIPH1876]|uniref:hypothetical protein n=1 Tax=Acinetobacter sp. NIPH1876 TaxID=2924041 RepID=UPI001FACA33B|nr:hypothetical protein [Acinetobacter sp. NIPH1876]MCJ0830422.1 hypothetical protein [Acinetobacter sp. NIPH1876]